MTITETSSSDTDQIEIVGHMSAADFTHEWDLIAYAQANPTAWINCGCGDTNCPCGGDGGYPGWVYATEIGECPTGATGDVR